MNLIIIMRKILENKREPFNWKPHPRQLEFLNLPLDKKVVFWMGRRDATNKKLLQRM